jgi:hypothetical protein
LWYHARYQRGDGVVRTRKGSSMKRLLALLATVGIAVAIYAATATGSQQAVTPAQFAALKKQVTTLQKNLKQLTDLTNAIAFCTVGGPAVPVNTATSWHTTSAGETQEFWVLTTRQADCANAINSPAFKRAFARVHR